MNRLMLTDSYKVTHWKQYPPDTTKVYSYLEARRSAVLFVGLHYFLKRYLEPPITIGEIDDASWYFSRHFGPSSPFNRRGWERILDKHAGRLPVRVRAVPEGSSVPARNVLMTVENTDREFPWLTNYLESLLVQVWYPSSVATLSRAIKNTLHGALKASGDVGLLPFKLHDFGFRGSTSPESAAIGGFAHLVNFLGTDTLPALSLARQYYAGGCAGFSVPAAEHSTITAWGRTGEGQAFANMLEQYPTGIVSVVSDSYDILRACRVLWGGLLRDKVLERDGVLVVRPDSGDPPTIVLNVIQILSDAFGSRVNDKGFRVLNDKVRIIQGDGIDHAMIVRVLETLTAHQWSADNIVFGSGGALLQQVTRDTHSFAFKCSYIERGGVGQVVQKDPVTDTMKRSKSGRLSLVFADDGDSVQTVQTDDLAGRRDLLDVVFADGRCLQAPTLQVIRQSAECGTVPLFVW